ncbi:MAG: hypothetical protein ACRDH5_19805, partial [bacterium]
MDPSTNTYTASPTNSMNVGTVDDCLTTIPGDPGTDIGNGYLEHDHFVDLIIRNVEDMVGWQARFNFIGDKMRISGFNDRPYFDSATPGMNPVGFTNLPKAGLGANTHRGTVPADNIGLSPVPVPDTNNTPQSVLIGSVYNGAQNFPISPDSPSKGPTEPTTNASGTPLNATPNYGAPTGGVLASLQLQVIGDHSVETGSASDLFINLDDGDPSPPESNGQIFTGTGLATVQIPVNRLGDGFHGEGVTCQTANCETVECPPDPFGAVPTPTPTNTPEPTATNTPVPTATNTPVPTATNTPVPTATNTPV